MIAKLKGSIDALGIDHLVIDVQGVGYVVFASARTLGSIGTLGETATIFTEMQVSENDMRLMGFASAAERDWFRLLTGVQGVGGKVALAILGTFEPVDLHRAIASADKAMVARANGVGPKLAARIVNELKDKVGGMDIGPGVIGGMIITPPAGAASDAVSALQNLGFKPAIASMAVAEAIGELGEDADMGALVRLALKKAAK